MDGVIEDDIFLRIANHKKSVYLAHRFSLDPLKHLLEHPPSQPS